MHDVYIAYCRLIINVACTCTINEILGWAHYSFETTHYSIPEFFSLFSFLLFPIVIIIHIMQTLQDGQNMYVQEQTTLNSFLLLHCNITVDPT